MATNSSLWNDQRCRHQLLDYLRRKLPFSRFVCLFLVIFFCIIYMYTYFKFMCRNNYYSIISGSTKVLQRRNYMQELALDLTKPWACMRLAAETLPRTVKDQISSVYSLPTAMGTSRPDLATHASMREPMVRCTVCPSKKDKKTRHRCIACLKAVCGSHYYSVCESCI